MNAAATSKALGPHRRLVIKLCIPELGTEPAPYWDVRVMLMRRVIVHVKGTELAEVLLEIDALAPRLDDGDQSSTLDP